MKSEGPSGETSRTPAGGAEISLSARHGAVFRTDASGRFPATNTPPLNLVQTAYGFEPYRILGAPDWSRSERYDVTTTGEGRIPPEQMRERMRSLLVDRFGLIAHTEMREMQTYALLRARADQQLGPNLKPWTIDCKTYKPPAGDPAPVRTVDDLARVRPCGMSGGTGLLVAGGRPIAVLVSNLAGDLRTPVTDHTGLTGDFEISLRWNPDPARDSEFPSLFTALQEQLGLKLESRRESIEVLVIDRLQRPTDN